MHICIYAYKKVFYVFFNIKNKLEYFFPPEKCRKCLLNAHPHNKEKPKVGYIILERISTKMNIIVH